MNHEDVRSKQTRSPFWFYISITVSFDLPNDRVCSGSSLGLHGSRPPCPFNSGSVSPQHSHTSAQVRLLLRGWVDETWSHSGRWWHWQEQPVTLICLNRVEAQYICSWRCGARGLVILWTSQNKHVYLCPDDAMWCLPWPCGWNIGVSWPGFISLGDSKVLYCLAWISIVCRVMFIEAALAYVCCHLC